MLQIDKRYVFKTFDDCKRPVSPHVVREINKRGTVTQKPDENGELVKQKSATGPTCMFGWGPPEKTPPVLKNYSSYIRDHFDEIISELLPLPPPPKDDDEEIESLFRVEEEEEDRTYLEREGKRQKSNYNTEVVYEKTVHKIVGAMTPVPGSEQQSEKKEEDYPALITEWYSHWAADHDNGIIGMVPPMWSGINKPTLEEVMESDAGKVLLHFNNFLKRCL